MDVPVLEGPEEVPVRAAEECAEHDQRCPQHGEPEQEDRDLRLALAERVVAVAFRVLVDVRDANQSDDNQTRQDDSGEPWIEVDQHFLQPEEVPRRFRRVRRIGRVGRLLERRLQEDRPDDQNHRARDERNQFGVDEIRPDPDAIRFGLLNRPLPRGNPPIVQHAFTNRKPDEEHEQEDEADDRHVVRLRDDEAEIRIEGAEQKEHAEEREQTVADGIGRDRLALPQHEDQRRDREHEEEPRIGDGIHNPFDEAHVYSKFEV